MKQKKKVTENLKFDIPKDTRNRYKPSITIGDLRNTKEVQDDDILLGYFYEERLSEKWGLEDKDETHWVPVVEVKRERWETDEEFDERLEREGKIESQKREREYQEYLRLKGLFENNS